MPVGEDAVIHPAIAPGAGHGRLPDDPAGRRHRLVAPEAALPAFLIIAGIPLTFSIAAGIGLGVLGYVRRDGRRRGRAREVHPLMWALVPLFVAFFASDWLTKNVF